MCTEKYISPFTDFGFKRLFGTERLAYKASLKVMRDNDNMLNSARVRGSIQDLEEGFIEGYIQGFIEGYIQGWREATLDMARAMRARGIDASTIKSVTGVDITREQ